MRKQSESQLVTSCLKWLQIMENLGKIAWCDRNNSGAIFTGKYRLRLHRAGTPDITVYTNLGIVIHIECKAGNEKQGDEQINFQLMVNRFSNHHYIIIRSSDELVKYFEGAESLKKVRDE